MNKGFNRKRSRYHSHKIDKFLLQEYEHRKKEIQLLLIGLPNSGKNTFCKQLRLHFGDGFPTSFRVDMKSTILANTTDAIALVLEYMKESNILFSDILAHRLQEYLVNSRSENGWITKDFILFEPEYNNTNSCSVFKRQEVTVKAKHNEKTDQINIPNYLSHNPSVMSTCTMVGSVATGSATTTDVTTDQSNTGDYLKPINDTSTTVNNLSTESYSSSFHLSSNTVVNKANTKSITDSIVERFLLYVNEHNSIPPSVLKKFESVIDIKSFDNWQNIIHDKVTLHHLIHLLLQSGIDNWSSFLMHSSTPPPAPTTLPPVSVEDELLDYIVTSESLDSSEEGEDDDDDSEDDRYGEDEESGLTNSSNSPPRTLVNSPSSTREIKNLIYYNDNDDDNDDHADSSDQEDIDYDDWENCIDHLADLKQAITQILKRQADH
ncbi:unnamed protein product [Heterobilharzia americana]|nr:unnamed protein product [Heterobilharzia americana]